MRALETRDHAKAVWTDADRAWASRAAAEAVGEQADSATFVARRARLALERVGEHHQGVAARRARLALASLGCVGRSSSGAFALGVAVDRIGGTQRINLLSHLRSSRFFIWNLGVYAVLAGGFVVHYGDPGETRIVRRLRDARCQRNGHGPWRRKRRAWRCRRDRRCRLAALTGDWLGCAAPLYTVRAASHSPLRCSHTGAGRDRRLLVRGLAFEYRADVGKHVSRCGQGPRGCWRYYSRPARCSAALRYLVWRNWSSIRAPAE